jgi:Tat protein secretion system quality control protein TatD with DNase activity
MPSRKGINEPAKVISVVEYISNLLNKNVKNIIFENSVTLFNLPHIN